MRPPPEPTFEAAVALEDVIKARILEMRFDNVVRVVPGGPQKERRAVDLNDAKAKQGLAEEYEAGLKRTLAGTSEDRSASTRKVCLLRTSIQPVPSYSHAAVCFAKVAAAVATWHVWLCAKPQCCRIVDQTVALLLTDCPLSRSMAFGA